jgi:hypothetical protein
LSTLSAAPATISSSTSSKSNKLPSPSHEQRRPPSEFLKFLNTLGDPIPELADSIDDSDSDKETFNDNNDIEDGDQDSIDESEDSDESESEAEENEECTSDAHVKIEQKKKKKQGRRSAEELKHDALKMSVGDALISLQRGCNSTCHLRRQCTLH